VTAVVVVALLSGGPHCAVPPGARGGSPEQRQPRFGAEQTPRAGCDAGDCLTQVFLRPSGCGLARRSPTRQTFNCTAEDRLEVVFSPDGAVRTRTLRAVRARNPYPGELTGQWRTCPFRSDRRLEAVAVPYEDPDVGLCYLLRDVPPAPVPERRLRNVGDLHPYLADCVRRMLADAAAEGDEFHVISVVRGPRKETTTMTKRVKRKGRWRRVKTEHHRFAGGGWHAFGLAFDINLRGHKSLKSATEAYLDGRERAAWERIGALGERFGLKWVGRRKASEIFHFEWHPGWPGMPRGELYQRLAGLVDRRGREAVWARLRYDRKRQTAFRHLRDP